MIKSMLKFMGSVLFIWLFIQLTYQTGDRKTTEEDFNSVVKELPTYQRDRETNRRLDSTWEKMKIKKDTTRYPGKWVDVN